MKIKRSMRILVLATVTILGLQVNIFARSSDGWKTVRSFYSWYLKSNNHESKKLKKFLSAKLYQKIETMDARDRNGYFTRKPADIDSGDLFRFGIDRGGYNGYISKKDSDYMYVHLWDKDGYYARMGVSVIVENGKWKINDAGGITEKEASEKRIQGRIEPPELQKNLIKLGRPAKHPPAAKAVRAYGDVKIEIVVDDAGKVASATALAGHPLLRRAAEQAALQSVFSPVLIEGKPTRITGIIVYTFTYFELYEDFPVTCC